MGIEALTQSQFGLEGTFGSAATPNRETRGLLTMDYEPERVLREESRASLGGPNVHDDLSYLSTGRYQGRAIVRELPYFWACSVDGTQTITTPSGGTLSRQHLYAIPTAGDGAPALKSMTTLTGDNSQAIRTTGVTVAGWEMTGGDTAVWGYSADLIGKRPDASSGVTFETIAALTGTALADTESALNKKSKVYADDTGAGLGGTQLALTAFGFRLTFNGAITPDHTMDNDLDMQGINRGIPTVTLEMTMKWNATAVSEWGKFRANTRRFIRIENIGSTIEGSITRLIRIDGAFDITRFVKRESAQDGTIRARLTATGVEDPTWGEKLKLSVINTLTAL